MDADANASVPDQLAAASVVFGLVSLVVGWWFPFGPSLGVVGAGLGVLAWWTVRDGGQALLGIALAGCGAGIGGLLGWDEWWRILGQ
jgi:hypothetical protein